jgi:hypothetical protein
MTTADSSPGSVVQVAANFAEGGPAKAVEATKTASVAITIRYTNFFIFSSSS